MSEQPLHCQLHTVVAHLHASNSQMRLLTSMAARPETSLARCLKSQYAFKADHGGYVAQRIWPGLKMPRS